VTSLPDIPWADDGPSHRSDALQLAQSGLHIFPLKVKMKEPATANGFKNATRDPNQIRAWWTQNAAYNIGVSTGPSGLLVIDIDGPPGEEAWGALHQDRDPIPTLTVETGRGRHLYYRHDHEQIKLGNSRQKLGADIDTRGDGGYVIAPPSIHPSGRQYRWADPTATVADLPDYLLELLKPKQRQAPVAVPVEHRSHDGMLAYVKKALEEEIHTLATATSGRNDQLNRSAYNLGQLVGSHVLDRSTAESELWAAATRNGHLDKHGDHKTRGTIQSGLNSGENNPRSIPPPRNNVVQHPSARRAEGPPPDYDAPAGPAGDDAQAPPPATDGGEPPSDDVLGAPFGSGGDMFRADLLVELHGDEIRHVPGIGWYSYDGTRWAFDPDDKAVGRLYRTTMDRLRVYAKELPNNAKGEVTGRAKALLQEARRGSSANALTAALRVARNDLRIHLGPDDLDRDDWLVNFPNGTLNLRTGAFNDHDPDDNISYVLGAPYDPDARHERLEQFLTEVMGGDTKQATALTRHFGLALTGDTSARKALFPHGPTTTGKSVFLDVMAAALGDYGKATKFEMFLHRQFGRQAGGPEPELLALRGRRFVYANEADEHSRLSQGLFKAIVSGDAQEARGMHSGLMVTFRPKALLCFASNERPQVNARDGAMWERIIQIPFLSQPAKRDPRLRDKLLTEPALAAMLRLLVDGFRDYLKHGLQTPARWLAYTEEYQRNLDWLGEFMDDRCIAGASFRVNSTDLYKVYRSWYEENVGDKPRSQTALALELDKAGIRKVKSNGRMQYLGIRIRLDGEQQPPPMPGDPSLSLPGGGFKGEAGTPTGPTLPAESLANTGSLTSQGALGIDNSLPTHKNEEQKSEDEKETEERAKTLPTPPLDSETQSSTDDSPRGEVDRPSPGPGTTDLDSGGLW